jgi:hypothetical protein
MIVPIFASAARPKTANGFARRLKPKWHQHS